MSKLGNFEGVESFETQPKSRIETIPSVTENDRKKLEHQRNKVSEATSSGSKTRLNSDKEKISIDKEYLNKTEVNKDTEKQGDLVQLGTARENPKYGKGGERQFFIRNAGNKPLQEDGRIPLKHGYLEKVGEKNLQYEGPSSNFEAQKESRTEEQKIIPKIIVDNTPLSKAEKDEWKQLDENTRATRDLPKVVKGDKEYNKEESWNYPHTNQENMGVNQDAFSESREMKDGEKFYQLRSADNEKTSNYFTDSETVDKCRKENGDEDVEKLLHGLQIDFGNKNDWVLREYVYHKNK